MSNLQSAYGDALSLEDKRLFLSNLATDISEKTNLAPQHPEIVERLKKLHADWLAAVGAHGVRPATDSPSSQDKKGNEK
jgi:hypothetical protein